ncbi:hypothetical protein Pfo_031220, partial [Paulownia fortunei]
QRRRHSIHVAPQQSTLLQEQDIHQRMRTRRCSSVIETDVACSSTYWDPPVVISHISTYWGSPVIISYISTPYHIPRPYTTTDMAGSSTSIFPMFHSMDNVVNYYVSREAHP